MRSDPSRFVSVTLAVSHVSLVFGELVPKRWAMARPAAVALFAAPVLDRVGRVLRTCWVSCMPVTSWVGLLHREDVRAREGIALPAGHYDTLAGFVVTRMGHTPRVGDSVVALGRRFTVLETDGHRAALVRVAPGMPPASYISKAGVTVPDGRGNQK